MPGRYIVIEGCDGSGKSTLISNLAEMMPGVLATRHPGATPLGQVARKLVKEPAIFDEIAGGRVDVDAVSAQILLVVDHIAFINQVLTPALAAGQTVLADRSNFFSGLIYGLAEGARLEDLRSMLQVVQCPTPDAVFILHSPLDVIDARLGARSTTDRFEKKSVRKIVHRLYTNIKSDRDIADTIGRFVPLGRIHYIGAQYEPQELAAIVASMIKEL
jgi:dTMP kinase